MICGVREAFGCSLLEILHAGLDTWDSKKNQKTVNMSSSHRAQGWLPEAAGFSPRQQQGWP